MGGADPPSRQIASLQDSRGGRAGAGGGRCRESRGAIRRSASWPVPLISADSICQGVLGRSCLWQPRHIGFKWSSVRGLLGALQPWPTSLQCCPAFSTDGCDRAREPSWVSPPAGPLTLGYSQLVLRFTLPEPTASPSADLEHPKRGPHLPLLPITPSCKL